MKTYCDSFFHCAVLQIALFHQNFEPLPIFFNKNTKIHPKNPLNAVSLLCLSKKFFSNFNCIFLLSCLHNNSNNN